MNPGWGIRQVPADLRARYVAEGYWTDASMGDMVAAGLRRAPDSAFRVHSAVRPWAGTVAEVDGAARRLASALQARGVGPGSIVVMQLPNWTEACITFWAACYLGAVVVPIVHFYGAKEVGYILDVVAPDVVVTAERFRHADYLATYKPLLERHPEAQWLVVGGGALPSRAAAFDALLESDPLATPVTVDPDSPAVIAFTSGTTSNPKGVVHSHRTIGAEMQQAGIRAWAGGRPNLTGAPVGHFTGMLGALLRPLFSGSPIHLLDVWNPAEVLRLIEDEGLSVGGGATFFLTSLLDHPDFREEHLAGLAFMGLGGAAIPEPVARRADALGITLFRSYGSTEHPSITSGSFDDPAEKRLTTDGRPMPGVDMRLDDEGEIYSRGPDCSLGYTDPALTAAAFDADGWYRTGDVGEVDDEGYLRITDRVSDVIIRGGENLSAQEIEDALLRLDAIAEVAVVAAPDERLGEHAAAVFTVRHGRSAPTMAEVREHLDREGLARQKWPEQLIAVDDLPRTAATGKVQKFQLRQQLREGRLG